MGRTIYTPKTQERAVYVGRFRGYRMLAFGKMQILDYEAEIEVYQMHLRPALWCAKDLSGRFDGAFVSPRSEDTQRLVHEAFVTCITPWQKYELEPFGKKVKLGPRLVEKPAKSA
jgi:hypothetical protein